MVHLIKRIKKQAIITFILSFHGDISLKYIWSAFYSWGHGRRNRMVVAFITTYAISVYHHWCCEFESRSGRGVQHYVIKCVSDWQQVDGFLLSFVFWTFCPSIYEFWLPFWCLQTLLWRDQWDNQKQQCQRRTNNAMPNRKAKQKGKEWLTKHHKGK